MKAVEKDGPACIVCGCTENNACGMGCYWVRATPPLCSNPMCQLIDALEQERTAAQGHLRGIRRSPKHLRSVIRSMGKLLRDVKKNRGELG